MLITVGLAFLGTLLATPLVRAAALRLGFLDLPGPRSSHLSATPRGGGVAILIGVALALVYGTPGNWHEPAVRGLLGGAALIAVVGLTDDRFGLPPRPRLLAQILAAVLVVRTAGGLERLPFPGPLDLEVGPVFGSALAVLWIVAVTNFFNFMDGIDGLAPLQGALTAGALAWAFSTGAPATAALAAALAGGSAGFVVYNWAPASIFLGDVGSETLGFTLASLALLAPGGQREGAVILVAASLFLFLADATTCLFGRATRGERLFEAHRRHLYQRWVATGATHSAVSLWLGLGAVPVTAVALTAWRTGQARWYWAALGLGCALHALERGLVRRREAAAR
jgi:Fuc2NAc and GlcNAc transferase